MMAMSLRTALAGLLAAGACGAAFGADGAPLGAPDTMAQRLLACTGCHGHEGKASNEGFIPRIAGKPAGYLQRQLLSFRDGPRRHDGMARLLQGLPDAYLAEMATYFALLESPPERPPRTPMGAAPVQRAEQLVRDGDRSANVPACAACHGERLSGRLPGVPGLAGLPSAYIVKQFGAWRVGLRRAEAPDCMHTIAQALRPEDITALADWLAAQPAASPEPVSPVPPPVACGGMASP